MNNFEQVKDVLDYDQKIHPDLRSFYSSINDEKQQTRIKMLLDFSADTSPFVETTAGHPENPTHSADPKNRLVWLDKGVLHGALFAKYAASFFRVPRSSRRIEFSRRNRFGSS